MSWLAGCADEPNPNPTEIWDLRADPSVCDYGVDYGLCGGAVVVETQQYKGLYQSIDGLDRQWGYTYRVEVEIIEVDDPGQDGSSIRYELVELIDQQAQPGLEFDFSMIIATVDVETGGGQLGYGTATPFTCSAEQCTELATLLADPLTNQAVEAVFRFGPVEQLFPVELVSFMVVAD